MIRTNLMILKDFNRKLKSINHPSLFGKLIMAYIKHVGAKNKQEILMYFLVRRNHIKPKRFQFFWFYFLKYTGKKLLLT